MINSTVDDLCTAKIGLQLEINKLLDQFTTNYRNIRLKSELTHRHHEYEIDLTVELIPDIFLGFNMADVSQAVNSLQGKINKLIREFHNLCSQGNLTIELSMRSGQITAAVSIWL